MASELKGKGLELVMIDFRENPDLVRRTVKERGYTGRALLDERGTVRATWSAGSWARATGSRRPPKSSSKSCWK